MSDPLFDLSGKVIAVTGGLGQLGQQFSGALLQRGAKVAVLDIAEETTELPVSYVSAQDDGRFEYIKANVTDRPSVQNALDRILDRWGHIDGLVNNAALDSPPGAPVEENGPFETYPEASWDKVMDVNVKGTLVPCQVLGGAMAEAGAGSIINVASIYGMVSPDQGLYEYRRQAGDTFYKPVAYSASKSAIYNLTRYMATYWASKGVRVNTVTFAGVFNHQDEAFLEKYCTKVPLGRMANADEYNGAIIFLMSDAASYMTGANMKLDGGFTAW
jgi:NAD(P)-dependent dehydrogenase (short-subunit alcohol dehydrogenase family)